MDAYEQLIEELRKFPMKPVNIPALRQILEVILTVEEAKFASKLPMFPFAEPLSKICDRAGIEPSVAGPMFESIADKGVAFARTKDGEMQYALLQVLPGIFELQFMKGAYDAKSKKLAHLFDEYLHQGMGSIFGGVNEPYVRTVSVQKEIPMGQQIQPYEQIKQLIVGKKSLGLATCYCRHEHELLGNSCDKPKDVCMVVGPFADFVTDRGFGRKVSAEECLDALDRAEEAGLVHLVDNITDKINFVCNCCGCCCGFLSTITKFNIPGVVTHSNYIIDVDRGACMDCGECVERCQVGALSMNPDTDELSVKLERCIGCGVCVRACEQEALSMKRRPADQIRIPHGSYLDMGMAILKSMKR